MQERCCAADRMVCPTEHRDLCRQSTVFSFKPHTTGFMQHKRKTTKTNTIQRISESFIQKTEDSLNSKEDRTRPRNSTPRIAQNTKRSACVILKREYARHCCMKMTETTHGRQRMNREGFHSHDLLTQLLAMPPVQIAISVLLSRPQLNGERRLSID